jgi:hypothetical protein
MRMHGGHALLQVDGQELLIKGNSATQRYVEAYEQEKAAARAKAAKERLEAAKKKQEEGEVGRRGRVGRVLAR